MKKFLLFLIMFVMSIIILNSAGFSIKLEKNLEIKGEGDNYFIGKLSSATIDKKGNIYITDSMQNKILKFNKSGKFLKKGGRKGEGPGEFPYPPNFINSSENKIYISLQHYYRRGIYVFNTDLKFLEKINYKKSLQSFYMWNNHFYIINQFTRKPFTFDILDKFGNYNGEKINTDRLPVIHKNHKKIVIDKEGNIYIISSYEDKIEKWNSKYKKIWSKYVFYGKSIALSKGPTGSLLPLKSFWFSKVAMDIAENIYILSGNIAINSKRAVYVISKSGKLLTIFTLPYKALYAFNIDQKNNLYIDNLENEAMPLTRYKLRFDSKKINLESNGYKFRKKSIQKGGMIFEYKNSKK